MSLRQPLTCFNPPIINSITVKSCILSNSHASQEKQTLNVMLNTRKHGDTRSVNTKVVSTFVRWQLFYANQTSIRILKNGCFKSILNDIDIKQEHDKHGVDVYSYIIVYKHTWFTDFIQCYAPYVCNKWQYALDKQCLWFHST